MSATLLDGATARLLDQDRKLLTSTQQPIVTVSASFRDVVEKQQHMSDGINHPDVVFSRAHYSMAAALAVTAWGSDHPDAQKAWLVDPTNYVTGGDWGKLALSETLGRAMARQPVLGWLKRTVIDRYGRKKKLPITDAIAAPLLSLCQDIERPIISVHDQAGNVLAPTGKRIVQVVTDPFVRPQYVEFAHLPTMKFCVFDENTRTEFFEVANAYGKEVDPRRVVVTGPPVDPRIVQARDGKNPRSWQRRPLRILLTTGGLGTNKKELEAILRDLLPTTRSEHGLRTQILYYAGTNNDHADMVRTLAQQHRVRLSPPEAREAPLRLLTADDVVTANNLLLLYGFPWADVVVTKPSGDMAYDAAAAGCALLFLDSWGDWEDAISAVFTQMGVGRKAQTLNFSSQLLALTNKYGDEPWIQRALTQAEHIPPTFLRGTHNILQVAKSW